MYAPRKFFVHPANLRATLLAFGNKVGKRIRLPRNSNLACQLCGDVAHEGRCRVKPAFDYDFMRFVSAESGK